MNEEDFQRLQRKYGDVNAPPPASPGMSDEEFEAARRKFGDIQVGDPSEPEPPPNQPEPQGELVFDSYFESGNLHQAYQRGSREYVLLLQYDSNTEDYSHWYYFSATARTAGPVQFHIVNLTRPEPLVADGLKPLVRCGGAWARSQEAVGFAQTTEFKDLLGEDRFYTLSFTHNFAADSPTYFAYAYPYTYKHYKYNYYPST